MGWGWVRGLKHGEVSQSSPDYSVYLRYTAKPLGCYGVVLPILPLSAFS